MPTKKKPRKAGSSGPASRVEKKEPPSNDLTQYVTTRQAADRLGVVSGHINHLLAKGKITGIKLGYFERPGQRISSSRRDDRLRNHVFRSGCRNNKPPVDRVARLCSSSLDNHRP